MIQMQSICSDS